MEQPRRSLFTTKSLILLILPIMGESLLAQLVGMVDGMMVSSVGEVAISAVSLVTNFSGVIINLLAALASGGTIVTSQLIGAGDLKQAKQSTGQLITMATIVSVIIGIFCIVFSKPLLRLTFGQVDDDVLTDAVTYFFYDAGSYPLLALCSAGGAILRAKGDSKSMFYVSLLRNAINVAGNAICIYGLEIGVAGVAIPTALSRLAGACVLLCLVMRKKNHLRPAAKDIFHINRRLMGKMLRIGLPTAIENSMFQLGRVMTVAMISGFGTAQIAANSTAGALCAIVVTFSSAVRIGAMNVIGQCVGAHDEKQLRTNFTKLMIFSYVANGVAAIAMLLCRKPLIGLYTGLSDEAVAIALDLMFIHLVPSILIYTPAFYITAPLRASNDGAYCMWVSLLSMVIFRLSLAQLLCVQQGWGARGVYCAMVVDWICRSICYTIRWYSGIWRKKCGFAPKKPIKLKNA